MQFHECVTELAASSGRAKFLYFLASTAAVRRTDRNYCLNLLHQASRTEWSTPAKIAMTAVFVMAPYLVLSVVALPQIDVTRYLQVPAHRRWHRSRSPLSP